MLPTALPTNVAMIDRFAVLLRENPCGRASSGSVSSPIHLLQGRFHRQYRGQLPGFVSGGLALTPFVVAVALSCGVGLGVGFREGPFRRRAGCGDSLTASLRISLSPQVSSAGTLSTRRIVTKFAHRQFLSFPTDSTDTKAHVESLLF